MKKFSWLIFLSAIAVMGGNFKAQAQSSSASENSDIVNLETITCRELLKSEGNNRSYLIVFMHAFLNGVKLRKLR